MWACLTDTLLSDTLLSQNLKDVLFKTIETALLYMQSDKISSTSEFIPLLDELFITVRREATRHIDKLEFKEAAEIYYLVAKILSEIAKGVKNIEISEILQSNSATWFIQANSGFEYAIRSLLVNAHKLEFENKKEDATIIKDNASVLKFEIDNGFLRKRLNLEAHKFINQSKDKILEGQSELIAPTVRGFVNRESPQLSEKATNYLIVLLDAYEQLRNSKIGLREFWQSENKGNLFGALKYLLELTPQNMV